MGDDKQGVGDLCVALGERDITTVLVDHPAFLGFVHAGLAHADRVDHGANHRPVNQVVAHDLDARIVTCVLQIGIQEAACELRLPPVIEIHNQERHFADDIDPAQGIAEFDTIEDDEFVIKQRYIAQMHVTVALTNETVLSYNFV